MKRFFALLFAGATVIYGRAAGIYVPGQFDSGVASVAPFGYGTNISLRYQQVYNASAFATVGQGGGRITGLAFEYVTGGGTGWLGNIQINLSTTSRAADGLSTTFAQNVGANDTQVLGPSFVATGNIEGYGALFRFSTPFLYNPSEGNLLVDLRVYQSGYVLFNPFGNLEVQAVSAVGDAISRVSAFDVNAATGSAASIGLKTLFNIAPVPEPGGAWLLVACFGTILFVHRGRTSKTEQLKRQ